MGFFSRSEAAQQQARQNTNRKKDERIERILNLPFPLSFPFYAASIAMITSSIFFFLNAGLSRVIGERGSLLFVTLEKKLPERFSDASDIRWLYYIPAEFITWGTKVFGVLLLAGILMLMLTKWMLFLYEKKNFAGSPRQ